MRNQTKTGSVSSSCQGTATRPCLGCTQTANLIAPVTKLGGKGPGSWRLNPALYQNFKIRERVNAEFRAESIK